MKVSTRWLHNCNEFKRLRRYPSRALSKEEENFPVAYAMVVYKDSAQVERLLRAIYQPQNVYCIHADLKSKHEFHRAIRKLADCFDNVFVASKLEKMQWGGISPVLADLHCMEDLLDHRVQWRYFINLCGQDFPLKTNLEIVKQLKAYDGQFYGRNCITGAPVKGTQFEIRTKYKFHTTTLDEPPQLGKSQPAKGQPPNNITLYKGDTYIAATRGFVDFIVNSNVSKTFLAWLNDTFIPDEAFTSSLHRLPQAPGGYAQAIRPNESNVRFRKWDYDKSLPQCPYGHYVRDLCIFSSDYLQYLWRRPELFVNKFHYEFDPVAMQCMEELLEYRTHHPEMIQHEVEYFPIRNYSWQTGADNAV
ncbi:beta-1,3-galactosyl-O-glycosyl-glycoprotein beta-1,6-N-acetylglucosaminyltransferase 4-like [Amphiura filiformis]|uniref:beta-1,3-galactosyl-O-glycosyl-glycoprotein beta-1,6-N-acetylglucosaminyltransferase 4-like n=1 Tax=Amphiura filiformis TaxID=82378 RepID=UPI003B211E5F